MAHFGIRSLRSGDLQVAMAVRSTAEKRGRGTALPRHGDLKVAAQKPSCGGIGWRPLVALGIAAVVVSAALTAASASDACDTDFLRAQAQQSFPDYRVEAVRAQKGVVTLLFAARSGTGTFAVALRASGTWLFTSVMGVRLDDAELARVSQPVASWYAHAELQRALALCTEAVPDAATGDPDAALHGALEAALADHDRGVQLGPRRVADAWIVVSALVLSLAIVLWPGLRQPRRSPLSFAADRLDLALVLSASVVAVAIAFTIAWRMAAEGDEVVTLGTRHAALSFLLSWETGGEPFNPPGAPTLFALWLRLVGGFFAARVLSIAFIPLTALVAYRAGTAMAGRHVGLSFAGLVVLAPAYLRLAAIARGYAMVAFSLCLLLATITRTKHTPSRGEWVGVASLLGLWASYLLWPLALAAPWIAPLNRRDRTRVMAALAVMVVGLAPRVANGFTDAMNKGGMFELHGLADTFSYALAIAGLAPPLSYAGPGDVVWPARAIAALLIVIAIVRLWQRDPRRLRDALLMLGLVVAPVLALLSGGHGIRDRHVICVQIAIALLVATGLGLLTASRKGSNGRRLGWLLALALAVVSVLGNRAVIGASDDWLSPIDRVGAQADLVMIVPQGAQGPVHAMLFGDTPEGSETVRWPPVCELGTQWWCRRVGGLQTVSVDEVTDRVLAMAATFSRSIWIFSAHPQQMDPRLPSEQRVPPSVRRCEQIRADSAWWIFDCSNTALRQE